VSDNAAAVQAAVESGAAPDASYVERMVSATPQEPRVATREDLDAALRPSNIPEKFWDAKTGRVNVDAMASAYAELERRFSASRQEKPQASEEKPGGEPPAAGKVTIEKKDGETPDGNQPDETADAPNPVTSAVEAIANAYAEKGEVPEEAIKSLVDLGVPKQFIDAHIAGIQALEQLAVMRAHEVAGGAETFNAALQWGSQNLTDAELKSYNDMVTNPETQRQGVEWLVSKFRSANPSEGSLIQADVSAGPGDVYSSETQMTADMRDPRYAKDPAFRQQVAEKIARSRQAGTLSTRVQHYRASR